MERRSGLAEPPPSVPVKGSSRQCLRLGVVDPDSVCRVRQWIGPVFRWHDLRFHTGVLSKEVEQLRSLD